MSLVLRVKQKMKAESRLTGLQEPFWEIWSEKS